MRKDVYLEELIQILEKEKKVLEKAIKEHVKEADYRIAHKYSKGLREICSRLRILYFLQDPYKEQRDILTRRKKRLTDSLEQYKDDEAETDYYLDEWNRLRNYYGEAEMKLKPFEDTQHIDDALYEIVEGVIKSFQLIFIDNDFDMKFERQPGNFLRWSMGPIKSLRKAGFLWKKSKLTLESLGFTVPTNEERYVYHYDLSTFKDSLFLKQMLARVIYDALMKGYPYETPKVELHREA